MTNLEKRTAKKMANKLAEAIHEFNQLNKEQLNYLDLLFQKLFIEQDTETMSTVKTTNKK